MANAKLWVAAVDGRRLPRPEPDDAAPRERPRAATAGEGPKPEEGLRLINAFTQIDDPYVRAELIEQAERYLKRDL